MLETGSSYGYALRRLYVQIIRLAFAHFYREFAWTYDTVAWLVSRGLWQGWATTALRYTGTGRVLELGFGTGYVQHALARQCPGAAVGLEASPQMIGLTRQRLQRAGLSTLLVRGIAQALPFQSACFNTVVATFPSEYILAPATQAEIQRVLAADGRFILVDAARFTATGPYERLVDLAYRLTGQQFGAESSAAEIYGQWMEQSGWQCTCYWETVGPSQVLVLVNAHGWHEK